MAIDWSKSYQSEFVLSRVDPGTWENAETVSNVSSIQIDRDCTDETPLLETGSLTIDIDPTTEFQEAWYRVNMLATQNGRTESIPISTLRLQSSSGSISRGITEVSVDGYSVLVPLSDQKLRAGEYVPKDYSGGAYLQKLMQECTPAPVVVESTFTLNQHHVFDTGMTYLEAVWSILDAANWCMQIDGYGTITVKEKPKSYIFELDRDAVSMLLPGINYNLDLASIPNRYTAVSGRQSATVVNNKTDSRVSYPARGWYVDIVDTDPTRINGESLEHYAARQLELASTITKTWSYTREYIPDILPFSLLKANLPDFGIDGDVRVLTQQLKLDKGIQVTEKIGAEIKEWTA